MKYDQDTDRDPVIRDYSKKRTPHIHSFLRNLSRNRICRPDCVETVQDFIMILGLTGAFGGGKSTVIEYFKNHSWYTFDADRACHALYSAGHPELIAKVKELFGSNAVVNGSQIDRSVIAASAFAHPEKMKALTAVLYPLLEKQMSQEISRCRTEGVSGIFELPLLYEAHYEHLFDAVLTIWTDPELRSQRLANRNFSPEDMKKRDARQLDPVLKLEYADYAVINNGSPEFLHRQLGELINEFEAKK